jgi:molecular chaperone DnaK (HSP70)
MAKEHFTTSVDGQTAVDMHVVQGERELARDNRSLARFDLAGIDPMPAGMPKIEVTFLIDANGILQVQARELRTGKAAAVEVKPTYGLTEQEVGRMVEDSFTHAEADVTARLLIEAQTEAGTVLAHVDRALRQGRSLTEPGEVEAIEAARAALLEARRSTDRHAIQERTTALNRATERLAERMMDHALKGALGSKRAAEILEQS